MQRTPTCRNCCRNYGFKDVSKPTGNRIPLLLDCGHTFCEGCVTKWARLQKTQVLCPECHESTPLPVEGEKGVQSIQANIFILGLMTSAKRTSFCSTVQRSGRSKFGTKAGLRRAINQFTQERKATFLNTDSSFKCEECSKAVATNRCAKCDTVYCNICFEKVHSYSNALRKHVPLVISQTSNETVSGCPEHDNRPFEFYDKDEGQSVCSHCVVVGERQNHNVIPIDEVAKDVQVQCKASLKNVVGVVKHLEMSQQKLCKALPRVKLEKNNVINEIREHFQELFALLQTRERVLVKDVEMHYGKEKTLQKLCEDVTENLQRAKNFVEELENLLRQPQKLIGNAKQLNNQLESLQEIPCCAVQLPAEEAQVKFEASGGKLTENIARYGLVSTSGNSRFVLKRLCEVTEEDLKAASGSEDVELAEANETPAEVESTGESEDNAPLDGSTRSNIAAKILKADIAYRHEMVHVTHIRDPCQFMVQRIADLEQLQIMMSVINLYCDSTENVHDLLYEVKYGDWCCAQFTTDNQWYRACVINTYTSAYPNVVPTLENGLCIEVEYIDYGNSEWLPLSRLRKMKAEFLEVPELAQCCSLADIVPPFQEEKWPPKAIKAFGSLTGEKPLLMTVVGKKGRKMFVDLRRPEDDEPTQDDDRPVSVRDALVFLEVARFSSPLSKPEGVFFPKKNYKEPTTIPQGAFIDVLVTHAMGPDEIYLQKLQSEETIELQRIMDEMSKMFGGRRRGTEWSVPWPYKGLVCASKFSEDKVWYRALVTAVNSDETVDVTYVDFGNSEKLPFSEVRKLPDMFLRLPKQAIPACLVDVKPNGDGMEWEPEDEENVANLLVNRQLVVDVKGFKDNKISVMLYDTSGSQDVCINEFLVQHGYCQPAGLGYVREMKKEKTENIKTGKSEQKKSVNRTLACSFKGFCSILKSREEIEADNESTTEQQEQQLQEKQLESSVADEVQEVECARIQERVNEEETHSIHAERLPSGEMPPTVCQSLLESQYKTANLPAGRRFQAGITFVDSQGYIYAQEVREGDRTLINIMSELLRKYGKGDDVTANPSTREATVVTPGLPCCAQYAEDGMWYRGRVVKFIDDEKVEVNYVDFGNSEVVSLSALRQERPFMDVPQQCLELVLHGVEPKTRDGHWPPKTISALSQLTVGQDCIAYIRGDKLPGYPLVVNLTLPDGTDVAQALLRNGLVQQSPTLLDTENPAQFSPKKTKPSKVKQKQSSRSITETREQAHKISSREAECVLAQTELPEDGIRFDVTITHIEQPDCLFIQRVPPSGADMRLSDDPDPTLETATYELRMLEQMMTKINAPEYFKKYPPLSTASQGMLCCAQYTEDDMWYRAQVKQVECEKPLQVQVLYVDYGTTEVIKADRLRGFPSELLDLPIQSTHCYIADVIPPDRWEGPMMDDKQWPVDTMETLLKLVAGKKLVAKTMFRGPPVSIMLYDHRTREDGCTEEVSIGLLLAQEGLAMSRDPDLGEVGKSALSEQYNSEPDKLLELPEMGLNFRHATSGTEAESKENISSNVLLENILAPKVGFGPAVSPTKQPLLSPSTFTAKIEEMTAKNSDLTCQEAATSPVIEQETGDQPHEQALAEPLKIDHVTNKSAVAAEVNEHYVESSV